MTSATLIVVGAGHATGELVMAVRQEGYAGRIVVIGAESHLPYQRPPLSKGYLSGEARVDELLLKTPGAYEAAQVEFMLDTLVDGIDRAHKRVVLADGRSLRYDRLALNVGGRARRLGGINERLTNLHYIRAIDDVDRLRAQLEPGLRLVIVGGGYIGLEVAAVAARQGLQVTVLEAESRVLARVTAPEVSAFYAQLHRQAGVDLRTGVTVQRCEIAPSADAVSAIICSDGARVAADVVIAAIGLIPNTELAQAAGLTVENGILVDEFSRTSDPDIVAAGDCASQPNALYGRLVRLESVSNAVEQARSAAATLCGRERPRSVVPWFWSDQYDLKLQIAGLSAGYDQLVLRGSMSAASFTVFYLKDGIVIAADAIQRPREFMIAKRLVAERAAIDPEILADESISLKATAERRCEAKPAPARGRTRSDEQRS